MRDIRNLMLICLTHLKGSFDMPLNKKASVIICTIGSLYLFVGFANLIYAKSLLTTIIYVISCLFGLSLIWIGSRIFNR